jgi:hypothetical protein
MDKSYVDYTLLQPLTNQTDHGDLTKIQVSPEGLSDYFNQAYSFLLILIAITAVFYLIYGGMVYLTTDIANKQKQGKEVIVRVISGLVFVFTVWLILNSINPNILNNKLTFAILDSVPSSSNTGGGPTTPPNNPPPNTSGAQCTPIPASDLVSIQGYQLKADAANNFNQMYAAAQKDGVNLRLTSGYRSPDEQTQIWNSYGCKLINGRASCRGGKSVAVPCSLGGSGSNHSTGYAVDISVGCVNGQSRCNTKVYNWLKANGGKYNFYNNLPSDPVHWSANGR